MRQVIIARKDLNMSSGKLAAQVSHGSLAYFTTLIKNAPIIKQGNKYLCDISLDTDICDDWVFGSFTKTICEAKNRNQLLKAKTIAEDLGLVEGVDFFLIKDNCLTELEPEEIDEHGQGRTLTCIGFKPLPDEIAHKISKKYQLYR